METSYIRFTAFMLVGNHVFSDPIILYWKIRKSYIYFTLRIYWKKLEFSSSIIKYFILKIRRNIASASKQNLQTCAFHENRKNYITHKRKPSRHHRLASLLLQPRWNFPSKPSDKHASPAQGGERLSLSLRGTLHQCARARGIGSIEREPHASETKDTSLSALSRRRS